MDLNLTAEEQQFRDELRDWLKANVPADWSAKREDPLETRFEYLRTWQRKLFDGGSAGGTGPKGDGGRGASLMQQVLFGQEMALADAPPMANALGLGLIGPTIIGFGVDREMQTG